MDVERHLTVIAVVVSLGLAGLATPATAQVARYDDVDFVTVLEDPDDHIGFFDIREVEIGELREETVVFWVETEPFDEAPPDGRLVLNFTTDAGNFSTGVYANGTVYTGEHSESGFHRCRVLHQSGIIFCEMSYRELGTYPLVAEGYRIINTTAATDAAGARQDFAPGFSWIAPHRHALGVGEAFEATWSALMSTVQGTVPWNATDEDPTGNNLTEKDPTGKNLTVDNLSGRVPVETLRNRTWGIAGNVSGTVAGNLSTEAPVGDDYVLRDPAVPADIRLTAARTSVVTFPGDRFQVPLAIEAFGEKGTPLSWSTDRARLFDFGLTPHYTAIRHWHNGDYRRATLLQGQTPEEIDPREHDVVVEAAGDESRDAVEITVRVRPEDERTLDLLTEQDVWTAAPGTSFSDTFEIRNHRDSSLHYDMNLHSLDGQAVASVDPSQGVLAPNGTQVVEITFNVPDGAEEDSYAFDLRVTADSGDEIVHRFILEIGQPDTEPGSSQELAAGESPTVPAPSLAVTAMAVAAAAVVLRRRR